MSCSRSPLYALFPVKLAGPAPPMPDSARPVRDSYVALAWPLSNPRPGIARPLPGQPLRDFLALAEPVPDPCLTLARPCGCGLVARVLAAAAARTARLKEDPPCVIAGVNIHGVAR